MAEIEQLSLMDVDPDWAKEWQGMPEFKMGNTEAFQKITVSFKCREDVVKFAALIGQRLTGQTDSIWFPKPGIVIPEGVNNYGMVLVNL